MNKTLIKKRIKSRLTQSRIKNSGYILEKIPLRSIAKQLEDTRLTVSETLSRSIEEDKLEQMFEDISEAIDKSTLTDTWKKFMISEGAFFSAWRNLEYALAEAENDLSDYLIDTKRLTDL